jgi:hypothetical protein
LELPPPPLVPLALWELALLLAPLWLGALALQGLWAAWVLWAVRVLRAV